MTTQRLTLSPAVKAQDKVRGHRFTPTADVLDKMPALYATEDTALADKTVWVHYFTGSCDWYLVELDQAEGIAFGYANLGDDQNAEWGYVDLNELGAVRGGLIGVERDMHWTPKPFGQIKR